MARSDAPLRPACDTLLSMNDQVELVGVRWPTGLLERTGEATLQQLAATFDPTGACLACGQDLGPGTWAAVVDAAGGPFGAWIAKGRLAHPDCLSSATPIWSTNGPRDFPDYTDVVDVGFQPFPVPTEPEGWNGGASPANGLQPFPMLSVRPAVDAFLIGVDPNSSRVQNMILREFHEWGWHRLRQPTVDGRSVDFTPPDVVASLYGDVLMIDLPNGTPWELNLAGDVADAAAELGGLASVIGARSLDDATDRAVGLHPGPLYAMLWLSEN